MPSEPSKELIVLDNPRPGRDYEIRCETPELTCLCPVTGQPDFATVVLTYIPDELIVELKSLKCISGALEMKVSITKASPTEFSMTWSQL